MTRVEDAAEVLARGGIVALTGAGISAESGIPTFRDPGGIWDRWGPDEFGTWEGVVQAAMTRPDALADFLAALRSAFGQARPGPAHRALARLADGGLLEAVITQNVDGLHQEAGSGRVVELHGSFARTVCLLCGHRDVVGREAALEHLDHAIRGLRTAFVPSLASLLPRCSNCGGPARPDFVAFEEPVQGLDEAERLATGCTTMLVVGTHGEVFPAAALPVMAARAGATVVEVSTGHTDIHADIRLRGKAGRVLPALVEACLK